MIARLDLAAIHDLREALPRFTHVPLAHLHHLNPEQRRAYWLDEISQSLANESSIAFVIGSSRERINGFIVYNDSPWDSEITGRRIGTVEHIAVAAGDDSGTEILQELLDELTRSSRRSRNAMRGLQGSFQRVAGNSRVGTARLSAHGHVAGFRLRFFAHAYRRNQSSETRQTIEDSSGETGGPASAHGDK